MDGCQDGVPHWSDLGSWRSLIWQRNNWCSKAIEPILNVTWEWLGFFDFFVTLVGCHMLAPCGSVWKSSFFCSENDLVSHWIPLGFEVIFRHIYPFKNLGLVFFFPMGIYCQGARPAEQFFHLFSEGKCAKKFATYPEESIRQAMKECILQDIYVTCGDPTNLFLGG